jgi:hypothetical protein
MCIEDSTLAVRTPTKKIQIDPKFITFNFIIIIFYDSLLLFLQSQSLLLDGTNLINKGKYSACVYICISNKAEIFC